MGQWTINGTIERPTALPALCVLADSCVLYSTPPHATLNYSLLFWKLSKQTSFAVVNNKVIKNEEESTSLVLFLVILFTNLLLQFFLLLLVFFCYPAHYWLLYTPLFLLAVALLLLF